MRTCILGVKYFYLLMKLGSLEAAEEKQEKNNLRIMRYAKGISVLKIRLPLLGW